MLKVLMKGLSYLFGAFCLAVFGFLISLTFGALGKLFPGSFANQLWGLVLFDIGALIWAATFIYGSETTQQYALSAIGFVISFVGTLGMVSVEVIMSGQEFVAVDPKLGQWLVYGFLIITALHAALIYAHHFTAAAVIQKIDVGIARGEIVTEAVKQATQQLDVNKARLARSISASIVAQVNRDLGFANVLDVVSSPADEPSPYVLQTFPQVKEDASAKVSPLQWLSRWWQRKPKQQYEFVVTPPVANASTPDAVADGSTATDPASKPPTDFAHLYPPNGDRQHPDFLLARMPSDEWQKLNKAWKDYDAELLSVTPTSDGNNGAEV